MKVYRDSKGRFRVPTLFESIVDGMHHLKLEPLYPFQRKVLYNIIVYGTEYNPDEVSLSSKRRSNRHFLFR